MAQNNLGNAVSMHTVDVAGLLADVLHDVDLAVGGPAVAAGRHHPEGGPHAQAVGQLDAGLKDPVKLALIGKGVINIVALVK